MDAGAEKHVGPPRTIEIYNFAAARSAEVQSLFEAVKDRVEISGGDASSFSQARHLRRRTTSHLRRLPYWLQNERKKHRGLVPRERKRSKNDDSPVAAAAAAVGPDTGASEKRKADRPPPCRRVRRRMEFQRIRQGEDVVGNDGTRRLGTHVWHAKRFSMTKCWGYSLAEGLPGRGRGSRSVLKWVKEAAVLHDASYYGLIELQGSSDLIARCLQNTVEPPIWSPSPTSNVKLAEAEGLIQGKAMLYHYGRAPYDAISPISFLWRTPTSRLDAGRVRSDESPADVNPVEERQLWIWVHPGAHEAALKCLSRTCEEQAKKNEISPVKCRSRRSEFARLEIMGMKATEVIRKVIHPTCREVRLPHSKTTSRPSGHEGVTSGEFETPLNQTYFSKAEFLPSSAVLALNVLDPRRTPLSSPSIVKAEESAVDTGMHSKRIEDNQSLSLATGDGVGNSQEGRTRGEASEGIQGMAVEDEEDAIKTSWWRLLEEGSSREVTDSRHLWNLPLGGKSARLAPMSEKKLCEKRKAERRKFLLNAEGNSSNLDATDKTSTIDVCPVLLLKSSTSMFGACGWTIILPIKWVHAFWIPLVFGGGHVIGLRERHWVATNAGIPSFPHDFPDCSTYAQLLTADVAALSEANKKRPPAKRAPSFLMSPLQVMTMRLFEDSTQASSALDTNEAVRTCTDSGRDMSHFVHDEKSQQMSGPLASDDCTQIAEGAQGACSEVVEVDRSAPDSGSIVVTLSTEMHPQLEGELSTERQNGDARASSGPFESPAEVPNTYHASNPDGVVVSTALVSDSVLSNPHGDTVEGSATDAAASIDGKSVDVSNTSDTERGCGECEVVATEDTIMSDGICETEGEKVGAAESNSDRGEKNSHFFFVARTQDALLESLKKSGSEPLLFLHREITSRGTDDLQQESLSASASLSGDNKLCYVRVLVSVPRKGVLEEGAVICLPFAEDSDAFVRFKHWQGPDTVQPKDAKRKKKCKGKGKGKIEESVNASHGTKEELKDSYEKAEAFCEAWSNNRRCIGLITSSAPRGSTGPCLGICDVGALLKLRAFQNLLKKRWDRTEIFVLAGNKYSTKLRPALISLHMEKAENDLDWM
ncbi:ribonuclease P/MRP protein subunit POP1 [Marchantia polymorpha subsp. ruderalis]